MFKIWLIVIFVASASAADLSSDDDNNFEDILIDPTKIRDYLDPFIDIVSEYKNFTQTSTSQLCAFGPSGTRVPRKVFQLNRMVNIRLHDVFRRIKKIMNIIAFHKMSGNLLDVASYKPLLKIESLYNASVDLLSVQRPTNEDYLRSVINLMLDVIGTSQYENIPNELLSGVHRGILRSSNAWEPKNFLNHLQRLYGRNLRRCKNFEDIQKIIYRLYLSLVGSELTGFLVFVQSHWFRAVSTGEAEIDAIKSAMGSSLERIEEYAAGAKATMAELAPKCECQPVSTMSIKTKKGGIYGEFYRIASTKEILFHTNATRSICVHLATNDNAQSILFDICLGTSLNTQHIIRKNGATISNVAKDPKLFEPGLIHHFRVSWSNNVLSVEYLRNRPTSHPFYADYASVHPIPLIKTTADADLDQISHYTVTSPFVDSTWDIINVQPSPTGPSDLVKQIKSCYCKKAAANRDQRKRNRPCAIELSKIPINGTISQSKCEVRWMYGPGVVNYGTEFSAQVGCIP